MSKQTISGVEYDSDEQARDSAARVRKAVIKESGIEYPYGVTFRIANGNKDVVIGPRINAILKFFRTQAKGQGVPSRKGRRIYQNIHYVTFHCELERDAVLLKMLCESGWDGGAFG